MGDAQTLAECIRRLTSVVPHRQTSVMWEHLESGTKGAADLVDGYNRCDVESNNYI